MSKMTASKQALTAVTALVATLVGAAPANAQSLTITEATSSDFSAVTLDGSAQTATATMSTFSVVDTRALAVGWHVTVQATRFRQWDPGAGSYVSGGATLPVGSLRMEQPIVTPVGTSSPPPTVTLGPYYVDGSAVKVASAAALTGAGRFDFAPSGPLTLRVPASAYAGTYRSEVTVSVASGP